jgi:type II secretory pathway component PulM
MKLGKDEIQKIFLGVLMLFGVLYSYFAMLLGPLLQRQQSTQQSIAALGPEILAAKAQIEKTRQLEQTSANVTLTSRQVEAMIPEGSPVAWFPPRMAEFFKRQGLDKASTRMNGEALDKELPGFRKLAWGVDLPKVEFAAFGQALAALENEEPLLEITALQIDASREDVEAQHVLLTVNNLVKQ